MLNADDTTIIISGIIIITILNVLLLLYASIIKILIISTEVHKSTQNVTMTVRKIKNESASRACRYYIMTTDNRPNYQKQ